MYCVYILYSKQLNVYYKGFSSAVEQRLEDHLTSRHKFTSLARDWKLVYVCSFEAKGDALIEERRLKRLNRRSLEKLINS